MVYQRFASLDSSIHWSHILESRIDISRTEPERQKNERKKSLLQSTLGLVLEHSITCNQALIFWEEVGGKKGKPDFRSKKKNAKRKKKRLIAG